MMIARAVAPSAAFAIARVPELHGVAACEPLTERSRQISLYANHCAVVGLASRNAGRGTLRLILARDAAGPNGETL